ncbi:hypothetical protein [Mycobacterium sp. MMS18-G62]
MHAASRGCEPAIPLVHPEAVIVFSPPGELSVSCPAGCGETILARLVVADPDSGDFTRQFTVEAPELHDNIYKHLRMCPSGRSWIDMALHDLAGPRPRLRSVRTR